MKLLTVDDLFAALEESFDGKYIERMILDDEEVVLEGEIDLMVATGYLNNLLVDD